MASIFSYSNINLDFKKKKKKIGIRVFGLYERHSNLSKFITIPANDRKSDTLNKQVKPFTTIVSDY